MNLMAPLLAKIDATKASWFSVTTLFFVKFASLTI